MRQRPFRAALLVTFSLMVGWWLWGPESGPSSKPLYATIEIGDVEESITAAGTLQPSRFVEVGAQVSGQLEKLSVEIGDTVTAGDLLASIDATVQENRVAESRARLRASEAQLSARKAALSLAEANAARQTRLMDDDASTQAEYERAVNSLASAQSSLAQLQSQIAQSKASLANDEAQLGYTNIYAPMAGTVVSIAMKEGQTLNASQHTPVVMTIADLGTMTVEAEVSEADVTKIRPGMEVYFTTLGSGDRRWYGVLRQVLPTPVVTNKVVLYTALFDVDNIDKSLLPSMTAQVFFVTVSARGVLKVPVGALSFGEDAAQPGMTEGNGAGKRNAVEAGRPGRRAARAEAGGERPAGGRRPVNDRRPVAERQERVAYVQVVNDDESIEDRKIRVGVTTRIAAEVLSGLEQGDRVVAGVLEADDEPAERPQPRAGRVVIR